MGKTHLVCHGSLNPEVQYVYHCTTHVPYNTAYTRPKPVRSHDIENKDEEEARELTLATTAKTMGPKTILMSMLAMSLGDQLRVRERCSLASGSVAEADTRGKGGSERDLESGTGIRGGEYEDLLPRYTSWDHYHIESITYRPPVWEAGDEGN